MVSFTTLLLLAAPITSVLANNPVKVRGHQVMARPDGRGSPTAGTMTFEIMTSTGMILCGFTDTYNGRQWQGYEKIFPCQGGTRGGQISWKMSASAPQVTYYDPGGDRLVYESLYSAANWEYISRMEAIGEAPLVRGRGQGGKVKAQNPKDKERERQKLEQMEYELRKLDIAQVKNPNYEREKYQKAKLERQRKQQQGQGR
ncbi:hypothetical protein BU24DRAFT_465302 [Aaosphaeria arxii CBS 175.79]|uniref:Uncharacterized protein n=1 Tax=Aaosphaeria arxii CBS 175.79 TaxID=1450172 RepID=A0A6A5XJF7_9PLEO|nr:uncharacterized protein BU24DRAFT_465302 [Aaosphaeria arxii CBS 175.79]KAF2012957.1 hypothetical protein BU24DRAFT_465302 [Aaosphaeria arxii CBS 175.79]